MTDTETEDWLLLYHTTGMNNRRLKILLHALGPPSRILAADKIALLQTGIDEDLASEILKLRGQGAAAQRRTESTMNWLSASGHHIVLESDEHYPVLLRQTDDSPLLLFVKGRIEVLSAPMFAVVGSRNCSHYGRQVAHHLQTVAEV